MTIQLSDLAKIEMAKYLSGSPYLRLSLIDGCCGKSFSIEKVSSQDTSDASYQVDNLTFLMPQEHAALVPDIVVDAPGPIEGFLITPKNAIGGCGCGRSFFIDEQ